VRITLDRLSYFGVYVYSLVGDGLLVEGRNDEVAQIQLGYIRADYNDCFRRLFHNRAGPHLDGDGDATVFGSGCDVCDIPGLSAWLQMQECRCGRVVDLHSRDDLGSGARLQWGNAESVYRLLRRRNEYRYSISDDMYYPVGHAQWPEMLVSV